jgi:hypothetical protein
MYSEEVNGKRNAILHYIICFHRMIRFIPSSALDFLTAMSATSSLLLSSDPDSMDSLLVDSQGFKQPELVSLVSLKHYHLCIIPRPIAVSVQICQGYHHPIIGMLLH